MDSRNFAIFAKPVLLYGYILFGKLTMRQISLKKQKLLILPDHLSSSPVGSFFIVIGLFLVFLNTLYTEIKYKFKEKKCHENYTFKHSIKVFTKNLTFHTHI